MNVFHFFVVLLPIFGSAQVITGMTYNIQGQGRETTIQPWVIRQFDVYSVIEDANPDYLGLQECVGNNNGQADDLEAHFNSLPTAWTLVRL